MSASLKSNKIEHAFPALWAFRKMHGGECSRPLSRSPAFNKHPPWRRWQGQKLTIQQPAQGSMVNQMWGGKQIQTFTRFFAGDLHPCRAILFKKPCHIPIVCSQQSYPYVQLYVDETTLGLWKHLKWSHLHLRSIPGMLSCVSHLPFPKVSIGAFLKWEWKKWEEKENVGED